MSLADWGLSSKVVFAKNSDRRSSLISVPKGQGMWLCPFLHAMWEVFAWDDPYARDLTEDCELHKGFWLRMDSSRFLSVGDHILFATNTLHVVPRECVMESISIDWQGR